MVLSNWMSMEDERNHAQSSSKASVKAQERDLYYNKVNLYLNCIMRYILMKWTAHPPGICRWGVRMALKELGIRNWVSSGLPLYMLTIRCISIIFCCSLFTCYYRIACGSAPVSQPQCVVLHLSLNIMRCISAELLYTYQTVGVCIREWFPDEATTDDTAL